MSLDSIRLFCDVVREGNFSRGAARNGITQSAASQRIRSLEQELGVELIDRSTRPCGLTPSGQLYYEGCRDILERYERLEDVVLRKTSVLRGRVDVASIYSADVPHLNEVREGFTAEHPRASVQIHYLQPAAVHEWVGILPQRTVRVEVARGVLTTAELEPTLIRPLALVHRRDRPLPPLVAAWAKYLRAHDTPAPVRPYRAAGGRGGR